MFDSPIDRCLSANTCHLSIPPSPLSYMSNSFGPELRLKKRREFLSLQSTGRKIHARHFLFFFSSSSTTTSRIGITITTKVEKRAVLRNKLRRRIREIFRHLTAQITPPMEMVVIARNDSCDLPFNELEREILYAIRKAGYLPT